MPGYHQGVFAIKPLFALGTFVSTKLIILVFVSVVMMTIDHHFNHLHVVRSTISVAVYPIEYLAGLPVEIYNWSAKYFSARNRLLSDNANLRAEHIRLELQLQKLTSLEKENARLRKLLSSTKRFEKEKLLIAELLSIDLYPYLQRVVLNKGTQDGVYEGQPLLGAKGIIGQVNKVGPYTSVAILITDPNHALLGVIARSGRRNLVVGTGNIDKLELQHVTNTADIKIGDLVITSGLDNRYPNNYPVAEITSIQQIAGQAFAKVEARPLANLNTMREILLIWPTEDAVDSNLDATNTTDQKS